MAGKAKPTPAKDGGTTPEGERIAKVLSRAGVASRREAERMIELGEVTVNGEVITSPARNVTSRDKITVRGEPLGAPEPARLWLYYKPEGLVTSASDEKGRETVFDNLPEELPRVMSVGRLDLNSEGLLLLTNDGELKRRLELPSTGWLRKYRVRVNGNPTDPDLEPLRKGITVDGERFQPMTVVLDRIQGANAWLTVSLREGRNREIRRAMAAIELTVNRLIRVSYGPFRLGELQPGQVEEVRAKVLRDQLGEGAGAVEGGEASPRPARAATRTRKPATSRLRPGEGLKELSEAWQAAVTPREVASEKASAEKVASRRINAGRVTTTGRSSDRAEPKAPAGPRKSFGTAASKVATGKVATGKTGASRTAARSAPEPAEAKAGSRGRVATSATSRGPASMSKAATKPAKPAAGKAEPQAGSRGGAAPSASPRSASGSPRGASAGPKPPAAPARTGAKPTRPGPKPGAKPGPKRGG